MKQVSIAVNGVFLSLLMVTIEVVSRYIFDTTDIGSTYDFTSWETYPTVAETILWVSLIEFFKKGWLYFSLLLFFEGKIASRILNDLPLSLITSMLFFCWSLSLTLSSMDFIKGLLKMLF